MSLLEKLQKAGSIKSAAVLSESPYFNAKDLIATDIPVINIAFSADPLGGLVPGLTVLAGESKSFKTLLMLLCMKAYLDKYPDAIALLYDVEFGITPEYLENNGIDISRVLHIPIMHIEELKFDISKRLEQIEKGDKVFVGIDSIGALASKKEVEDAVDEKSVADMSRAKALKSLFRIIGPQFTTKDIPCVAINHVYKELAMYPRTIVGGGTGIYYTANTIFIITKSQEKDGTDIVGWNFTLNIEKSRFVREKAKFMFTVLYGGGILKYSGLLDLAVELGYIKRPNIRSYVVPLMNNDKPYTKKEILNNSEVWELLTNNQDFRDSIYNNYSYAVAKSVYNDEDGIPEDRIKGDPDLNEVEFD